MKNSKKVSIQTIQNIEKTQASNFSKTDLKHIKGGSDIIIEEAVIG